MLRSIRSKIFQLLAIKEGYTVKVYDGYGDADDVIIFGHVLSLSPMRERKYYTNWILNTLSLLRLFIVRPVAGATVMIDWRGTRHKANTSKDGSFKIEWKPGSLPAPGWHKVTVSYEINNAVVAEGQAEVFTPHQYQFAFISDIDDTFLISHSSNLLKRLYVLLTENAKSRSPFADVVEHYRLLSRAHSLEGEPNPFFYVSSSEWNLYDYIRTFAREHGLPRGVFLLNTIKTFGQFWKTGQGKHEGKFFRIIRILKAYPHHKYVLLGDDSQQDPSIYASVVEHFPGKIFAVYIRRVHEQNFNRVEALIKKIENEGVQCCYFKHSAEAIAHSKGIGLIAPINF